MDSIIVVVWSVSVCWLQVWAVLQQQNQSRWQYPGRHVDIINIVHKGAAVMRPLATSLL